MTPRKRRQPNWEQEIYTPPPGVRLIRCVRCGAAYLDDEAPRRSHVIVFGHDPAEKPARPGRSRKSPQVNQERKPHNAANTDP